MTPQPSEWPPSVPSLGRLMEIGDRRDVVWFLRRNIWRILTSIVLMVALTAVYNYFNPPVFVSEARVRFMPPQVAGRFVNPNFSMEVEQRLFALGQLLNSRLTATKLIDSQKLYPELRRFQTVADLTPRFQSSLNINHTRGADSSKSGEVPTMSLSFAYADPEKAQKVVQKLVEQIYEENRKYRGDQSLGTTEFLTEQLTAAEEAMLEAEQRLGDIQDVVGSTTSATKLGQATSRSYVIDSRLRDIRHDNRGLEERKQVVKGELERRETLHKRLETRPLEFYFAQVESLEAGFRQRERVMAARAKAVALRDRWQPGYPELEAAEQEAAEQDRIHQNLLKDQARGLKQRDLEDNAAKLAEAKLTLRALERESEAQGQEEAELRAESQRLREQMNAPAGQEVELLAAKREYDNAVTLYNQLLKKQEESKAASDLERRGQGETVELLEPASLPTQALSPRLWQRYAIAVAAGLVLGVLFCLVPMLVSPLILHDGHLEAWAGLPVLASFPAPPAPRRSWFRRRWAPALTAVLALILTACSDAGLGAAALCARGRAEEQKGKLGAAMIYYRQAIRQDARFAPAYEAAARVALRMGEMGPARDFLARAIEFSPNHMEWHKLLADVSYQIYFADPSRPLALLREVEAQSEFLRSRWPQAADGYRIAAQVLMERHRLEEAAQLLSQALPKVPRNESLRAQLAAIQFRLGETDQAESTLRQLLAERPQYRDAYDMLYLQLMQKQQGDRAREVLAAKWKALGQIDAALQLAAHDDAQGKRAEVRSFLISLEASAGQEPLGLQQIGDFWLHRGEWAAARQAYQSGLSQDQGNRPQYVGRLAEWHLVQGQNKSARELLESESKRYPDNPLLEAYVAAVRLGELPADRRAEERRRLESILTKMPDSPFVRYHLGRAYLLENRLEAAAEQFERSIKLDANYAAGWMALAEIELARGNASLAEARANTAMQAGQQIVPALMIRAKSQALRGKFAEAQKSFASLLQLDPKNLDAQFWQANTIAAQGKAAEAAQLFSQGRQAEANNPRWILAEAASNWSAGRTQQARQLLEEAAKLFPTQQAFEEKLGDVQLSLRDGTAARQTFTKLAQAQPSNVNYQLGLAAAHALSGGQAKALLIYAELQQKHAEEQRVWLESAALLDEMGRSEDAIHAYRKALQLNKANPVAMNNLAWRLIQQGKDLEQALELAQNAKRLMQRAPEIDGTLAEAYTRLSMHRNAAAVYEEMLGYIDPENKPRIQKLLETSRKRGSAKGRIEGRTA